MNPNPHDFQKQHVSVGAGFIPARPTHSQTRSSLMRREGMNPNPHDFQKQHVSVGAGFIPARPTHSQTRSSLMRREGMNPNPHGFQKQHVSVGAGFIPARDDIGHSAPDCKREVDHRYRNPGDQQPPAAPTEPLLAGDDEDPGARQHQQPHGVGVGKPGPEALAVVEVEVVHLEEGKPPCARARRSPCRRARQRSTSADPERP